MNLKLLPATIISTMLLFLTACSPKYYIPNTQNVPQIHAKNDASATVAGNANQFEFQGAYGISNNIAVQLNGGIMRPEADEDGYSGSGDFVEAGLGYYTHLSPNIYFSTYALIGAGSVENKFPSTVSNNPSTTGKISANLTRFGIQPGISYHTNYFSVTGSARFANLTYSNIDGSLIFANQDQERYLKENDSNLLFEPALTLRGGYDKVKLQMQITRSFNLTNSDFRQDEALLSLGVNFVF